MNNNQSNPENLLQGHGQISKCNLLLNTANCFGSGIGRNRMPQVNTHVTQASIVPVLLLTMFAWSFLWLVYQVARWTIIVAVGLIYHLIFVCIRYWLLCHRFLHQCRPTTTSFLAIIQPIYLVTARRFSLAAQAMFRRIRGVFDWMIRKVESLNAIMSDFLSFSLDLPVWKRRVYYFFFTFHVCALVVMCFVQLSRLSITVFPNNLLNVMGI